MNEKWRPYLAGALAGVLAVLSVVMSTQLLGSGKYLGASTTFVRAAGLIEQGVVPGNVTDNAYFQKNKPKVDWQMMVVAGILLGAFAASRLDGSFKLERVPPVWADRFGSKVSVRAIGAFLGGAISMFGARLADGCPSGHGLSGLMQLSISGFISMVGFFGAGVVVANLIYRKGGAK